MGMGAAGRRPLTKDKRVQGRGDASRPVKFPSQLRLLMIIVSDPTSRLRLLSLSLLLSSPRAGESRGHTCLVTSH